MKYIIELEEEQNGLYKAKNFNTLVFDKNGLKRLEPYEEEKPDLDIKFGDEYCYIDNFNDVVLERYNSGYDENFFKSNHLSLPPEYTDLMKQFALDRKLNNQLLMFSLKNGGFDLTDNDYHIIGYDAMNDEFSVFRHTYSRLGAVRFKNRNVAFEAITKVVEPFMKDHPEFKLYKMDYKVNY